MKKKPEPESEQMAGFLPYSDRVVIAPDKLPEVSKGGIHIPQTSSEMTKRATTGTVVAFGDGRWTPQGEYIEIQKLLPGIKLGARVLFGGWAGIEITLPQEMPDGEYIQARHFLMRADDIYGLLTEENGHEK